MASRVYRRTSKAIPAILQQPGLIPEHEHPFAQSRQPLQGKVYAPTGIFYQVGPHNADTDVDLNAVLSEIEDEQLDAGSDEVEENEETMKA